MRDLNPRPSDLKSDALPTELTGHIDLVEMAYYLQEIWKELRLHSYACNCINKLSFERRFEPLVIITQSNGSRTRPVKGDVCLQVTSNVS